jgi:hypothetical protein
LAERSQDPSPHRFTTNTQFAADFRIGSWLAAVESESTNDSLPGHRLQ